MKDKIRYCEAFKLKVMEELRDAKWKSSMTEELHCYENAMAERLNGILKHEYFFDTHFKTKKEAIKAIEEAIRIYNTHAGYTRSAATRHHRHFVERL